MKALLLALLLSASAAFAQAATPPHQLTGHYSIPELDLIPICSTTVTTNCVVGVNLYLVGGNPLTLLNILPVPPAAGSVGTTVQTAIVTPFANYGTNSITATVVVKDQGGNSIESAQSAPSPTFRLVPYQANGVTGNPQ